jgi:DNA-binding MarR family transcriptional regulator
LQALATKSHAIYIKAMTDALDAPIPEIDEFLCFAIHSTGFGFNRFYRRSLVKLGLTYPQFTVMVALWGADELTVGALGAKLSLDTSTLTPLLKRLETQGLLTRRRSPADERRVIVSLTERGSAMRSELGEIMACVFAATGLPAEAFSRLREDILTLRGNLERAAEA